MKKINIVLVKSNFLNFKSFFLGLSIFTLMIDSGGSLGVRNFGLTLFIFFTLFNLFCSSINLKIVIIISLSIIISLLGVFSNIINDIEISKAYQWITFLIMIFIFYKSFLLFSENEFISGFLLAGFLFSISVLLVHFLLITNLFISQDELLSVLNIFFNGFFHHYSIVGFDYYSIYFQATLTLVVFTIIAYLNKSYKLYSLFLFVIAISLSRFGFAVAILIPVIIYFTGVSKLSKIITIYIIPFVYVLILAYFISYFIVYDNFSLDVYAGVSSSDSRIGSLISTINSFNFNNFFIGQGLGSEFYSISNADYINNTELSQLEFLRKFGFIAFLLFHFLIFLIMYFSHKRYFYKVNIFIFTFYVVSISNPILTSLLFSMLIGYSLSRIKKQKKEII